MTSSEAPCEIQEEVTVPKRKPKQKSSHSLVRAFRALEGISQGELANRLGCSQVQVSRLERRLVTSPKKARTKLAQALGVSTQTLFPNIEEPHDVSEKRGGNYGV